MLQGLQNVFYRKLPFFYVYCVEHDRSGAASPDFFLCMTVCSMYSITCSKFGRKISVGYDIGERSLVPNGSRLFIDIYLDGINPYGP